MTYVLLLGFSIIFIESFLFLDLGIQARRIITETQRSYRMLADRARTDEEKETHVRKASRAIVGATAVLALKLAVIMAALAVAYGLVVLIRPEIGERIFAVSSSPVAIALLTIAACAYGWLRHALLGRL